MRQCLLLNMDRNPVRIISAQDAVVLILTGDAESLEESPENYHSAGGLVVNVPSVLVLNEYKKIPVRTRIPVTKRYVLARDNGKCGYCGGIAGEIDHVIPRSRGGKHQWSNVIAADRSCNSRKADKLLSEIGWTLDKSLLKTPEGSLWVSQFLSERHKEWEPYLAHLKAKAV